MELFRHAPDSETHPAGTVLIRQGTPGDRMFIIQEGRVDIQIDGRTLEQVGPGGFFGEMSLVDKSPRSATAIAVSDVRLVALDEKKFLRLVQETPGFAVSVIRGLARRLREMDAHA